MQTRTVNWATLYTCSIYTDIPKRSLVVLLADSSLKRGMLSSGYSHWLTGKRSWKSRVDATCSVWVIKCFHGTEIKTAEFSCFLFFDPYETATLWWDSFISSRPTIRLALFAQENTFTCQYRTFDNSWTNTHSKVWKLKAK